MGPNRDEDEIQAFHALCECLSDTDVAGEGMNCDPSWQQGQENEEVHCNASGNSSLRDGWNLDSGA